MGRSVADPETASSGLLPTPRRLASISAGRVQPRQIGLRKPDGGAGEEPRQSVNECRRVGAAGAVMPNDQERVGRNIVRVDELPRTANYRESLNFSRAELRDKVLRDHGHACPGRSGIESVLPTERHGALEIMDY
jgi:hypothetical protein